MKPALTQKEIIEAIAALAEVIKANKGTLLGDEDIIEMANAKLKKLIPLISEMVLGDSSIGFITTKHK